MIILNEREYAEKCLEDHSYGDSIYQTLQILAKYYYAEGFRTKRIEKKLLDFLQKNYPRYQSNVWNWHETVERIAKKAGKYPLYEINEITITKAELDTIDAIAEKKGKPVLRRLAFTLLCLAKLGNLRNAKNNGWVNTEQKEVFKMAHISTTRVKQSQMLGDLMLLGLIELPKKNDNMSNRITFINDDSPGVLMVSDFRELGFAYLLYCGEHYVRCAICGRLFKGLYNNARKYCLECSREKQSDMKALICVDCGQKFYVLRSNKRTIRCSSCQHEKDKYNKRIWKEKNKVR